MHGSITTKLGIRRPSLGVRDSHITYNDHSGLRKEIMFIFFSLLKLWYNHIFTKMCLLIGSASQVSNFEPVRLFYRMGGGSNKELEQRFLHHRHFATTCCSGSFDRF